MSATLQVFSSGSIGNSYCLDANGEKLLIEVGIPWRSILKSLNFNLEGLSGVICSHSHRP